VRYVDGTSREVDSVEQSCCPEERLDAGRIHSLRYCGAVPLRVETTVRQHTQPKLDPLRDS